MIELVEDGLTLEQAQVEAIATMLLWRHRLNLGEWHIDVQMQTANLQQDPQEPGDCLADCSPDPVYLQATIRIFPAWGLRTPEKREAAIIHELCHCLTQEARDLINRSRMENNVTQAETRITIERLTQRIANAVLWRDK